MAESRDRGDMELVGAALQLHNGPLQSMFAGIMILEGRAPEAIDSAIGVLRDGVRELNEIIESIRTADDGRPPTILVVEDNDAIRSLIVSVLEVKFNVVSAEDIATALKASTTSPGEFDVAICDINLPGGTGPALIERLEQMQPGLKTVFISGGQAGSEIDHDNGNVMFLAKPFRPAELTAAVEQLLGSTPS